MYTRIITSCCSYDIRSELIFTYVPHNVFWTKNKWKKWKQEEALLCAIQRVRAQLLTDHRKNCRKIVRLRVGVVIKNEPRLHGRMFFFFFHFSNLLNSITIVFIFLVTRTRERLTCYLYLLLIYGQIVRLNYPETRRNIHFLKRC